MSSLMDGFFFPGEDRRRHARRKNVGAIAVAIAATAAATIIGTHLKNTVAFHDVGLC
jgi:hypothetical protein